jgi:hypothetical protein
MSKGQNGKKDSKKKPMKTLHEKKEIKREKKEAKKNHGLFEQHPL